jgi:hypothetical protein
VPSVVLEAGYEGLVAKDEASLYVGGPHPRVAQGEAAGPDGGRTPRAAEASLTMTGDGPVSTVAGIAQPSFTAG